MRALCVSYKRHRFPSELIAHAVWLYFRFPLSFNLFVPSASITTALSRHIHRVRALAQWNNATALSA